MSKILWKFFKFLIAIIIISCVYLSLKVPKKIVSPETIPEDPPLIDIPDDDIDDAQIDDDTPPIVQANVPKPNNNAKPMQLESRVYQSISSGSTMSSAMVSQSISSGSTASTPMELN